MLCYNVFHVTVGVAYFFENQCEHVMMTDGVSCSSPLHDLTFDNLISTAHSRSYRNSGHAASSHSSGPRPLIAAGSGDDKFVVKLRVTKHPIVLASATVLSIGPSSMFSVTSAPRSLLVDRQDCAGRTFYYRAGYLNVRQVGLPEICNQKAIREVAVHVENITSLCYNSLFITQ